MALPPGTPEPASVSPWQGLWFIVIDPAETFRRLGARPAILPAYALHMLAGLVSLLLVLPFTMKLVEQGYTAGPADLETLKAIAMGGGIVASLVAPWFVGLLISLVALFFGQFHGGTVPFSAYFGMTGYARVPLVLSTLLVSVWTRIIGNPLDLSLAAFLPTEASPHLRAALAMANPFGLWYYALLATGFAVLLGKPPAKGMTFAVILFVISALGSMAGAAFASAPSQFQ